MKTEYRLDELFDLQMGKTPARNNPAYWDSEDHKWISIADLSKCGKYIVDTKEYLSEKAVQESGISQIPENTVIMSFKLSIGKTAITPEPMYSNEAIMSFRDKHVIEMLPDYIYYMFSGKDWEAGTNKAVMGKTLNKATLSGTRIKVHDIEEQRAIVAVLDKVKAVLNAREEELEKLDELIKARFVEMFDDCSKELLIGDAISICRGASPRPIQAFITDSEDGVNWIKIGDVSENSLYITKTAEKITREGAKKSRAVHKGDFILSNSMSFGRPYILGIDGCVHDGWLILSYFSDTFQELYLYHALRSEGVQRQFSGKVNGATVKNLNSDLVKATYIKVPDMDDQNIFAEFVKQVDKSKVAVQKALDEAQLLFDSLMQEYFG